MKPNQTNYHSHCDYCDGHAPMEDFVQAAIAAGFTSYGVSSHSPLPDYTGHNNVLQRDKVDEYINEIKRLKIKYANKIELYASMEIDYIDDEFNPANEYFQSLELDYRIGSVHFLKVGHRTVMDADTRPDKFVINLQQYYDNDLKQLVVDYFDTKMRMISLGGFDFVGHADKVSMNAGRVDAGITSQVWYRDKIRQYFEFIARSGIMLEINTKAFHSAGLFFPNEEHFRLLRELQIPLVVNSDAHSPHLISSGRMEAIERLKSVGYKTVRELHGGVWQDIKI